MQFALIRKRKMRRERIVERESEGTKMEESIEVFLDFQGREPAERDDFESAAKIDVSLIELVKRSAW